MPAPELLTRLRQDTDTLSVHSCHSRKQLFSECSACFGSQCCKLELGSYLEIMPQATAAVAIHTALLGATKSHRERLDHRECWLSIANLLISKGAGGMWNLLGTEQIQSVALYLQIHLGLRLSGFDMGHQLSTSALVSPRQLCSH